MSLDRTLAALRSALDADPRNGALWLHYAELLESSARTEEALNAYRAASAIAEVRRDATLLLVRALRAAGQLAEALIRAEGLLAEGEDPELRAELEAVEAERGGPTVSESGAGLPTATSAPQPPSVHSYRPASAPSDSPDSLPDPSEHEAPSPDEPDLLEVSADSDEEAIDDDWAAQFDWGDLRVTLADVAGLEDVKRQIELRVIAPMRQPEIYEAFGRRGGGGLLMYGPPGCGKTFVARGIAGELGARFVSISLHDILDKYWGETEKAIHALFEDARRRRPTVLFFDEFDALGASRGSTDGSFWKSLVNSLLSELDGVDGRNEEVLICGATNLPWDVDVAFRRPGRFDRVLFVPPPDLKSRVAILQTHLKQVPGGSKLDVKGVAKKLLDHSGADVRAIAERAAEFAIDRSLGSGTVHPVNADDLRRAAEESRSSIVEWFATARNYAKYSNEGGRFDDIVNYLKRSKRW